ncbi:MAG: PIN domain-containing protein [Bacteroidota bacterium]|nr:PIN domain-containing protein [Bacteroidota bacterium]
MILLTKFTRINLIPEFILHENSIIHAKELCENVDIKDTNYVALAIDMNLTLLTRDVKLYKGIRKKKFKDVMLFNEFIYNI